MFIANQFTCVCVLSSLKLLQIYHSNLGNKFIAIF